MKCYASLTMNGLSLTVVICVVSMATAQIIHVGKCPDVTTVPDFDIERYLGDWYEITKFFFSIEKGEKCIQANYSLKADGHVMIVNRAIKADGTPDEAIGDAEFPDPDVKSKMSVQFAQVAPRGNYWVVETDYDNYSLVWSCTELLFVDLEFACILSRKRTLDDATVTRLKQKLSSFGIDTSGFMMTDQTNCPA